MNLLKRIFISAVAFSAICSAVAFSSGSEIEQALRSKVIKEIASHLKEEYVFPDIAEAVAKALLDHERRGDYKGISDNTELSIVISKQLREMSHDKHLDVRFNLAQTAADGMMVIQDSDGPAQKSHDFTSYKLLPDNVALVDIRGFPPLEVGDEAAEDVMNKAADASVLIIDLRNNGGGRPEMVSLISSYLFDATPIHLNDLCYRHEKKCQQFWTSKNVVGKRFGSAKPVYVLVNGGTFSAAEEFSYDLQALKRATIVGEVTLGGANPGDVFDLGDGFSIFIPKGRAVNPITHSNWEGVGVKPDIEVPSGNALITAQRLILTNLPH